MTATIEPALVSAVLLHQTHVMGHGITIPSPAALYLLPKETYAILSQLHMSFAKDESAQYFSSHLSKAAAA